MYVSRLLLSVMDEFERKYNEARKKIQEWDAKQGHDQCWYYPKIFRELATILDVTPTNEHGLHSRCEFREGCKKYGGELYDGLP